MRLSEQERAANRAAFRQMSAGQKAEYVFAYYKLPLVIGLVLVVALGTVAWRALTHKEPLLYLAYANVVPTPALDEALGAGYVQSRGANPRRSEVLCYRELYLTADAESANHQYAYASKLKLMAAIEAEQLDVALMNQEAYDLLSASGYLAALDADLAGNPLLRSNDVVLSSNAVEVELGEADQLDAEIVRQANALEVTDAALLQGFAPGERFYLGVIANTPRRAEALAYLAYVSGA